MLNIKEEVLKILPQVIEWRHQVHSQPELANEEYLTSALVEKVLRHNDIEVIRYPGSTAVVGLLKGGLPGKTIGLRADMDALPIQELTELSYKSTHAGVMHACGHDIHTAVLLGAASVLAANREQVPGTVKFLFQPAEELPPGGAKGMVAKGVLKNPDVDMVLALHVAVGMPCGEIEILQGYSHANTDGCTIKILAKGAHGAYPHLGVDAVQVAGHVIVGLHTIVSRTLSPLDSGVITVGSMHAGTVNNIIAETAELKLTVRTLKAETREQLKKRIIEVAEHTALAHGAHAEVDYWYGYPSLFNSDAAVAIVESAAQKLLPKEKINYAPEPGMGGEDFAYFANEVPGALFYLGAHTEGDEHPGHNPRFNASDDCLSLGVQMMVQMVFEPVQ